MEMDDPGDNCSPPLGYVNTKTGDAGVMEKVEGEFAFLHELLKSSTRIKAVVVGELGTNQEREVE